MTADLFITKSQNQTVFPFTFRKKPTARTTNIYTSENFEISKSKMENRTFGV